MASNTSSLTFKLFGKDESASRAFRNVEKQAGHTSSALGRIGTGAIATGAMLGSLGATGVLALTDMAVSAVSTGVQTAAAMEQAQVGFTTLIGSAKGAQTFLAKLSDFAAATPFELPGLIESSRTLLGVGVSADQVIPTLTAFGDAAGAVGIGQEQFQRIMIATSQAIGAGKFQTADLNQIMNNGLPVWSILSKAMGKPVSVLRDMASKGKLLSKDVLPVLQKQMEKDYGGSMAKQSQTLSGIWSTLQDTFSQGMAKVLVPLLPMLKNLATNGIGWLGTALSNLSGFLNNAMTAWDVFTEALGGGETTTVGFLGRIGDVAWFIHDTVIPTVQHLASEFMKNVWPAIQQVAGMIATNLQPVIESLSDYWTNTLSPGIRDLLPILQKIATWVGVVAGALLVAASWIIGKVAPVLITILGGALRFTIAVLGKVVDAIQWAIDHWGTFVGFIKKIPGWISAAFSGLVAIITAPFRIGFNQIAWLWNHTVGALSFGVPDWVPGIGGKGWDVPDIPALAKGGIVTRPTLALIGEAGPEAVVPLGRGRGMGTTVELHLDGVVLGGNRQQVGRDLLDAIRQAQGSGRAVVGF